MQLTETPALTLSGNLLTLDAPTGTELGTFVATVEVSLELYPTVSPVQYSFEYTIIQNETPVTLPTISYPPSFDEDIPEEFMIELSENWTYSMPGALDGEGEILVDYSVEIQLDTGILFFEVDGEDIV